MILQNYFFFFHVIIFFQLKTNVTCSENVSISTTLYTQQKKKRNTKIFPFRSPFNTKMSIVMKYSYSDQMLLKLRCDVDEYLYFPFEGTKHIKANGKRVLEALIQRHCLYGIPCMFYIFKA